MLCCRACRVVSAECYPYTSGRTDETGECLLTRRPSTEATVNCPRPPPTTSRLYQATPPYRISPSVRYELTSNTYNTVYSPPQYFSVKNVGMFCQKCSKNVWLKVKPCCRDGHDRNNKKLSYRRETARQRSAAHVYLGWLTDRAMHRSDRTLQNRRGCTISDIQTLWFKKCWLKTHFVMK